MKKIANKGPRSAKLVIVGEAPGGREWEAGIPFVGPSGHLLESWMLAYGIPRQSVFYTNTVNYWPGEWDPKRKSNEFRWIPKDMVEAGIRELHKILNGLDDPWLIVPTGNQALRALFGAKEMKIGDYRGSILSYTDGRGRNIKVIPTIHPAATFRRPILTKFCLADWRRIAGDLDFRDLKIPVRQHHLIDEKLFEKLCAWLGPVAVDIECEIGTGKIQCVAFSYDPSWSVTIPIWYRDDAYSLQCWKWLQSTL